ncbi:hypothetical protein C8J56DRAFT_945948 [Mycena floridula]|nr:hypothetical protein C8J56DRAFT_945948 [Mycena floridula]
MGSLSGLGLWQDKTDLSKVSISVLNILLNESSLSSSVVSCTDEIGPSKAVPYSNNRNIYRSILERSIKPEKVPLPVDWDNNWDEWECRDAFTATFERAEFQIYLEVKFHIVFDEVELLMFLPYLELVVFRYRRRYYQYEMRSDELAVYETTSESVDSFLEEWDEVSEKMRRIRPEGSSEQCREIISNESEAAHEIYVQRFGANASGCYIS